MPPQRVNEWARSGVKKLTRKYFWVYKTVGFLGFYSIWILGFRLLVLSLITYFLNFSSAHSPHFGEISEAFSSNVLSLMGLSAAGFVFLLRGLNPLTTTTTAEMFPSRCFEKHILPGAIQGAVLSLGIILAFLISGLYRYLGFFIQFEEAPLAVASVLIRILSLAALVYFEEYIFRSKVIRYLRMHWLALRNPKSSPLRRIEDQEQLRRLPRQLTSGYLAGDLGISIATAFLYCGIKLLQFDLGFMHVLTLFLISVALSLRALATDDFTGGAGFLAALLIIFHPLLSLPILGSDFSGILLVKFQAGLEYNAAMGPALLSLVRFFTGGAGGPISSFAIQLILVLEIARSIIRHKKILLNLFATR